MKPRHLCGACATDRELPNLHVSTADVSANCIRCGFPTHLLLDAPAPACTHETHDALRADVALFEEKTTGREAWAGLLTGQCTECLSTIALPLCALCPDPCPSGDALPWGPEGEGRVAHFGCAAKALVHGRRGKFVIVVGAGQAKEFARTPCDGCRKFIETPFEIGPHDELWCEECSKKVANAFAFQAGASARGSA